MSETDNNKRYLVVLNHEEQYSIWALDQPLPNGWKAEGKEGSKEECLEHIKQVWTDMRPLSLRQAMAREATVKATTNATAV